MDDFSPYFWLLCQQRLKLGASELRRLILTDPDQRQCLLSPGQQRQFASCVDDSRAQVELADTLTVTGQALLCLSDADYPALLKEINDPPPLLFYRGDLSVLAKPMIALVGSRRPSRTGERDAEAFGRALAEVGFTVVSGLALGIDGAAHRGALAVGGATLAVLGCGVDVCYPRRHASLYREIGESGLLLSELAPGSAPLRHQFPRRNRIISGLSLGVVVVEAAVKSGSLITARQAMEQNREVFALPGSIHNPASRGCNALIREGAKLIETLEHILEEFRGWHGFPTESSESDNVFLEDAPPMANPVYQLLAYEPQSVDCLAAKSGLAFTTLLGALSELELDGWAEQQAGEWLRCL